MHHIYFVPCDGGYVLNEQHPRCSCVSVEIPQGYTFRECILHSEYKIPQFLEGIFNGRAFGGNSFLESPDWKVVRKTDHGDMRLRVKRHNFCAADETEPLYITFHSVRVTDWLNDEGDIPEIAELVSNVLTAAEMVRITKRAA